MKASRLFLYGLAVLALTLLAAGIYYYPRLPELVEQQARTYLSAYGISDVELVSLLSDEGLHCLPVLNEAGYLVGIVSQTDLIAALYRNWLQHLGQADQIT